MALLFWIVAGTICVAGPIIGFPFWAVVLAASPFAALAGWHLVDHSKRHTCGWCGRRFDGAYEWCCPDCEHVT